jgi:hypothetical protein
MSSAEATEKHIDPSLSADLLENPNKSPPANPPRESHVTEWKPSMDRRQSFNREELKHDLQMKAMAGPEKAGFSERA